jgi:transposase
MFAKVNHQLPIESRAAIVALRDAGKSVRQIAEQIGVHKTTVYRWLKKYDECGDVRRKEGSGRKKKTTAAQDNQLIRLAQEHPFKSAKDYAGISLNLT